MFIAIDADTKLVPQFEIGKRNMTTAYRLMDDLKRRLPDRFQLTTDGFPPYMGAVERAWGANSPDFAQLVKLYGTTTAGPGRYSPPKITDAIPTVIWGNPDPDHIFHQLRRVPELDCAYGLSQIHAVDQCLQREARQPEGRRGAAFRPLRLRADSR